MVLFWTKFGAICRSPKFKHGIQPWALCGELGLCWKRLGTCWMFWGPSSFVHLSLMPICHKVLPARLQTWTVSQSQAGTSETLSSFLSEAIHAKYIVTEMRSGKDTTSRAVQCYLAGTGSNGRQGNRGRLGAYACCVLRHLSLGWELCGVSLH